MPNRHYVIIALLLILIAIGLLDYRAHKHVVVVAPDTATCVTVTASPMPSVRPTASMSPVATMSPAVSPSATMSPLETVSPTIKP